MSEYTAHERQGIHPPVREWAKGQGVAHVVYPSRGKGGHKIVQVGALKTTVKTGEIGPGLLAKMMADLGIPKGAF